MEPKLIMVDEPEPTWPGSDPLVLYGSFRMQIYESCELYPPGPEKQEHVVLNSKRRVDYGNIPDYHWRS